MTTTPSDREDRSRVTTAVREARNELLASADTAIRQSDDYMQNAQEGQRDLRTVQGRRDHREQVEP
jgi:hypothetical protein